MLERRQQAEEEVLMLAYKKYVTINDPTKIELTDLPFRKRKRVAW
jgi:hypothetical protein